jgi:hypothetical protein
MSELSQLSSDELRSKLMDLWRQRRAEFRLADECEQSGDYVSRDNHRMWALHRGHDIQAVVSEMKSRRNQSLVARGK